MKAFLKNTILFTALLLAIVFLIQFGFSSSIKGKTITGHDNLEQTSGVNADLVFIGSSRCWSHFDPKFFEETWALKSVNIGINGHSDIQMMNVRLNHYLSHNSTPKYVVMNFDPFVNAAHDLDSPNVALKNNFARYTYFPEPGDSGIINYFGFDAREKYMPLYALFKYKLVDDALFQNKMSNYVEFGYEKHDNIWDTIMIPVSKEKMEHYFKTDEIPEIKAELKKLQDLCHSKDIKLLCIQTPVYKVLYDEALFLEAGNICRDLEIPFVDVNEAFVREDVENFYNSNHLNTQGLALMNALLKDNQIFQRFLEK